jgi:hypothetical protein
MGTERDLEYEGPCLCGKGRFRIDCCTPDHGWSVSVRESYETHIQCADCSSKYELHQFGKQFGLVKRSDIAERESHRQQWHKLQKAMLNRQDVHQLLDELAEHLDGLTSLAAKHRTLSRAGLEYGGIAGFRKGWQSGSAFAKRISGYEIKKVLGLLKSDNADLAAACEAIEAESDASRAPLPMVGEPVYSL